MRVESVSVDTNDPGRVAPVLDAVRRGWWIVLACGIVVALCGFGYSMLQSPVYRATAAVYVTSGSEASAQTAYQGSLASQQRVASYAELASSDEVIDRAISQGNLGMSRDEVREALQTSAKPDTVMLNISADAGSSEKAAQIANAVADSLSGYVATLESPAAGGQPLAKVTPVTHAESKTQAVSPKPVRDTLLAFLIGIVLGLIVLFVKNRFDRTVTSTADLEDIGSSLIFGSLPFSADLRDTSLVPFNKGASALAEAFRMVRTNLAFANVDDPVRAILITSGGAAEGKTTTAVNLARCLAEAGKTVILVDADLRRPAVATALEINPHVGLTDYLGGEGSIMEFVQPSGTERLSILAAGSVPPNPAELVGSRRAADGIAELRERFDFVIIDSPPVLPVTDAVVMSQWVDCVALVVRSGKTLAPDLRAVTSQFEVAGVALLGFVLNGVRRGTSAYSGGYTYYSNDLGKPNSTASVEGSTPRGRLGARR
ncbi:polysaccharide biosynthesis tyrosine autokinase [Gordonia polyisoprenivorans]|uniref:polysaccharide biosynthesis tyrosine autokinase n=1 Tax=Gordonia polyisoprenivorans TaxID=84595 RepID=UPI001B348D8A|nr:polysaccharide biosynthesis tyrosine autokinase [Gordonia polyisoprenivorans]